MFPCRLTIYKHIIGAARSLANILFFHFRRLNNKKNYEVETGLGYLTDGEPLNFDSAMIGHFHRIDEIDIGTGELHICGCMKGPDEFALQRLHTATKPKQIVTYWHPKYGSIGKEIIYLNIYDKTVSKFKDSLPEVWAS